jgi:hypothetical protein
MHSWDGTRWQTAQMAAQSEAQTEERGDRRSPTRQTCRRSPAGGLSYAQGDIAEAGAFPVAGEGHASRRAARPRR